MFSFFANNTPQRDYIPDSIYTICGKDTDCDVCKNVIWSPVVNGMVQDTQRGKVFCPFGKGDSLNTPIFSDQIYLNRLNNLVPTTWGRVPQLSPRPLAEIGLEWRTS